MCVPALRALECSVQKRDGAAGEHTAVVLNRDGRHSAGDSDHSPREGQTGSTLLFGGCVTSAVTAHCRCSAKAATENE